MSRSPAEREHPSPASSSQDSGWWRRRVIAPLIGQLKQGTSPRMMSATIAAGALLGIFPLLGTTTLLCGLVALFWRLNQPVIQLVNYLMYPVQIALLFPFYRLGEKLFQQAPVPLFSIQELSSRFTSDPIQFFIDYGMVGVYGVVVWGLAAPVLFVVIYLALLRPVGLLADKVGQKTGAEVR